MEDIGTAGVVQLVVSGPDWKQLLSRKILPYKSSLGVNLTPTNWYNFWTIRTMEVPPALGPWLGDIEEIIEWSIR